MVAVGVDVSRDGVEAPPHAGRIRSMKKLLRNRMWRSARLAENMRRLTFIGLNIRIVVYGATPP